MRKICILPLLLIAVFLLCIPALYAQVKTKIYDGGIPVALMPLAKSAVKERIIVPPPVFRSLRQNAAEKKINDGDRKFALPVPVNIDVLTAAAQATDSGALFYALVLNAADAVNISVQFSSFRLSPHAVLSIFTDYELTDSITAKANNKGNIWATRVYQGNKLSITLRVPAEEANECALVLSSIGFGFRASGASPKWDVPGASAACNVNVACSAGTGWDAERNAVGLIVSGLGELHRIIDHIISPPALPSWTQTQWPVQ